MGAESEKFLTQLSEKNRVLLLGGLAIIAHGLSRTTEDADVWLDSTLPLNDWLKSLAEDLPVEGYYWDLLNRQRVAGTAVGEVIQGLGVVRIGGLDRYVDVFRKPNELTEEDFEAAWKISRPHLGKIRLLDETFLIVTKENSERQRDRTDISFLESKLRTEMSGRLAVCNAQEAVALFDRYIDHVTCEAALTNPDPEVKELGLSGLRELAADGNPFALAALKKMD